MKLYPTTTQRIAILITCVTALTACSGGKSNGPQVPPTANSNATLTSSAGTNISTPVATNKTWDVMLTNPSSTPLEQMSITDGPSNETSSGLAATTSGCSKTLSGNSSCSIALSYDPQNLSSNQINTLKVSFEQNNTLFARSLTFHETTTKSASNVSFTAPDKQLTSHVGQTSTLPFVLYNNDSKALTLSSTGITLSPNNTAITINNNSCGSTIAAGQHCTVTLAYTPKSLTDQPNNLTLSANYSEDNGALTYTKSISGISGSIETNDITVSPESLEINTPVNNASKNNILTIKMANPATPISHLSLTTPNKTNATFNSTNNCGTLNQSTPSCAFNLTITPTASNPAPTNLVLHYTANNQTESQNIPVTIHTDSVGLVTTTNKKLINIAQGSGGTAPNATQYQQVFSLTNSGGSNITGIQVVLTQKSSSFKITNNSCLSSSAGLSVDAFSGCQFTVNYLPTALPANGADETAQVGVTWAQDQGTGYSDNVTGNVALGAPKYTRINSGSIVTNTTTDFNVLATPSKGTYGITFASTKTVPGTNSQDFSYAGSGAFPGTPPANFKGTACSTTTPNTKPCYIFLAYHPTTVSNGFTANIPFAFSSNNTSNAKPPAAEIAIANVRTANAPKISEITCNNNATFPNLITSIDKPITCGFTITNESKLPITPVLTAVNSPLILTGCSQAITTGNSCAASLTYTPSVSAADFGSQPLTFKYLKNTVTIGAVSYDMPAPTFAPSNLNVIATAGSTDNLTFKLNYSGNSYHYIAQDLQYKNILTGTPFTLQIPAKSGDCSGVDLNKSCLLRVTYQPGKTEGTSTVPLALSVQESLDNKTAIKPTLFKQNAGQLTVSIVPVGALAWTNPPAIGDSNGTLTSSTVTLKNNTAKTTLDIQSLAFTGGLNSVLTAQLSSAGCNALAPGKTCNITLALKPGTPSAQTGNLQATYSIKGASNSLTTQTGTIKFYLSGQLKAAFTHAAEPATTKGTPVYTNTCYTEPGKSQQCTLTLTATHSALLEAITGTPTAGVTYDKNSSCNAYLNKAKALTGSCTMIYDFNPSQFIGTKPAGTNLAISWTDENNTKETPLPLSFNVSTDILYAAVPGQVDALNPESGAIINTHTLGTIDSIPMYAVNAVGTAPTIDTAANTMKYASAGLSTLTTTLSENLLTSSTQTTAAKQIAITLPGSLVDLCMLSALQPIQSSIKCKMNGFNISGNQFAFTSNYLSAYGPRADSNAYVITLPATGSTLDCVTSSDCQTTRLQARYGINFYSYNGTQKTVVGTGEAATNTGSVSTAGLYGSNTAITPFYTAYSNDTSRRFLFTLGTYENPNPAASIASVIYAVPDDTLNPTTTLDRLTLFTINNNGQPSKPIAISLNDFGMQVLSATGNGINKTTGTIFSDFKGTTSGKDAISVCSYPYTSTTTAATCTSHLSFLVGENIGKLQYISGQHAG